jgi:hypothetical protein
MQMAHQMKHVVDVVAKALSSVLTIIGFDWFLWVVQEQSMVFHQMRLEFLIISADTVYELSENVDCDRLRGCCRFIRGIRYLRISKWFLIHLHHLLQVRHVVFKWRTALDLLKTFHDDSFDWKKAEKRASNKPEDDRASNEPG